MSNTNLFDMVNSVMNQTGVVGFALGGLVAREILERSNIDPEIVQLINRETINAVLKKVASGDIIVQDQVVTGVEYSPEVEEKFREIAKAFLEQQNQDG